MSRHRKARPRRTDSPRDDVESDGVATPPRLVVLFVVPLILLALWAVFV